MKCYRVYNSRRTVQRLYAGTQAQARAVRLKMMADLKLQKKDIIIAEEEIPTAKDKLLEYLNAQVEIFLVEN